MSALFEQLAAKLMEKPGRPFALAGVTLRESAVLVPLYLKNGAPHVLLTRRPSTMRSHAGQIAFPGGVRDPEDQTLLHTALRESEEELCLPRGSVRVLGQLDQCPTITGFLIHPFVGFIEAMPPLTPSPAEVAEVLEVPLPHLLSPGNERMEKRLWLEKEYEMYFYDFGAHVIWGATAHILKNLFRLAADLPSWQQTRTTT